MLLFGSKVNYISKPWKFTFVGSTFVIERKEFNCYTFVFMLVAFLLFDCNFCKHFCSRTTIEIKLCREPLMQKNFRFLQMHRGLPRGNEEFWNRGFNPHLDGFDAFFRICVFCFFFRSAASPKSIIAYRSPCFCSQCRQPHQYYRILPAVFFLQCRQPHQY